ncbi:porin family protein [Rhodocaloribacter litoris]|uniref:outer membrane beta-barrel protein n=1 Tax=Rhodocaloribacter litoris TaxID=2558931 RepID=UPI0014245297|nr:outer membrane beta-barrel protein [Rhodocaloribacter litoris]QXD16857.1 porin family protein [Rhodocaloribacter litoris]
MSRTYIPLLLLAGLFGLETVSPVAVRAQVSGISYTLTPSMEHIEFDRETGLDNAQLFGGRVGFAFGEYVELSGLYLYTPDGRTRLSRLSVLQDRDPGLDLALLARDVTLRRYGGQLKFNLGTGPLHPYLVGGTGIFRFEPDNLERSETIYLSGGAGLQYALDRRYTFLLQVEALTYRHNTATLLSEADLSDLGLTRDDFALERKTNIGVRAGFQLYLGGRRPGELTELDRALERQFSGGLRNLRLQIEPFWGQVDFDASLGFQEQQRMAGVFAGLDFGPYVGVRGFYWRGVQDGEIARFVDLQAYGGEMKLAFATSSQSLTPYLTLGGGVMDVFGDYRGNAVVVPEDQTFAMAGVGASLPLGETIRLHGSVRSLLMSTLDAEEVSDPNQIQASFMYSAGLSFSLGRRGPGAGELIGEELGRTRREALTAQERLAAELEAREQAIRRAEARIDSLAMLLAEAQQGNAAAMERLRAELRRDSLRAAGQPATEPRPATASPAPATAARSEGREWVTLPVPTEGELYVRYGRPGGVSVESLTGDALLIDPLTGAVVSGMTLPDSLQALPAGSGLTPEQLQVLVRQAVQAELARTGVEGAPAPLDAAAIDQLARRFENRLAEVEQRLQRRMETLEARQQQPPVVIPETQEVTGTELHAIYPMTGFNLNNPQQVLLGVRVDFRRGTTGALRFLPELVFGFGENDSQAINFNVAYPLRLDLFGTFEPYAGAGLGFISADRFEAALNLLVGVERPFNFGTLFGEYLTVDFFDQNRLLFGYRFRF